METLILSPLSPTVLIALGVLFIALEALVMSFVVIWFGVGLIVVGISSYFIHYTDGMWQLALSGIVAMLLLFILRSTLMKKFCDAKDRPPKDDFLNEAGEGVIKDGKVYYKSIFWTIDSDETFQENDKVTVLKAYKGRATVKRLKER